MIRGWSERISYFILIKWKDFLADAFMFSECIRQHDECRLLKVQVFKRFLSSGLPYALKDTTWSWNILEDGKRKFVILIALCLLTFWWIFMLILICISYPFVISFQFVSIMPFHFYNAQVLLAFHFSVIWILCLMLILRKMYK